MMAEAVGISLRSVQRIWAAHKLQPHRLRTFKGSRDPEFAAELGAIVGPYMAPPRHAVVLSVDEKSQIQALDRTQPGLPLKPGKAGTMTHDYVRNGTTPPAYGSLRHRFAGRQLQGGVDGRDCWGGCGPGGARPSRWRGRAHA